VNPYGGGSILIEYFIRELPLQYHLCALWEDEVIKQTRGGGCLVEP